MNVNGSIKIDNFVQLENIRHKLVKSGNLYEIKKIYKKKLDFVQNKNSGKMWDEINLNDITKKNNPMAWDRSNRISKMISGYDARILNIGFGSGILEKILHDKNLDNKIKLEGIDISIKSVRNANRKYPYWNFIHGSVQKATLHKEKYDYIIASEVFEHINASEIFGVLKKLKNSLKTRGKLIVSVPLNEGLEFLLKNGSNPNAHVRIYTEELIASEIELCGYLILKKIRLFAFHDSYNIKSLIARNLKNLFKPNNIIILAEKK